MENGQSNSLNHSSIVNHARTPTTAANHMVNAPIVTSTPPLVLSLSQVGFIDVIIIAIIIFQLMFLHGHHHFVLKYVHYFIVP